MKDRITFYFLSELCQINLSKGKHLETAKKKVWLQTCSSEYINTLLPPSWETLLYPFFVKIFENWKIFLIPHKNVQECHNCEENSATAQCCQWNRNSAQLQVSYLI